MTCQGCQTTVPQVNGVDMPANGGVFSTQLPFGHSFTLTNGNGLSFTVEHSGLEVRQTSGTCKRQEGECFPDEPCGHDIRCIFDASVDNGTNPADITSIPPLTITTPYGTVSVNPSNPNPTTGTAQFLADYKAKSGCGSGSTTPFPGDGGITIEVNLPGWTVGGGVAILPPTLKLGCTSCTEGEA